MSIWEKYLNEAKKPRWNSLSKLISKLEENGYLEDVGRKKDQHGNIYHEFLLDGESWFIYSD